MTTDPHIIAAKIHAVTYIHAAMLKAVANDVSHDQQYSSSLRSQGEDLLRGVRAATGRECTSSKWANADLHARNGRVRETRLFASQAIEDITTITNHRKDQR